MSGPQQRKLAYGSLALIAIIFIGAVMASNTLLRGWRLDLTENGLYTLSPGTRSMLANLEERINLYLFYSDRETEDVQYLRSYATRVTETLQEFVNASGGRLGLSVIDPVPFSEDEDRAAQYGLTNLGLATLGDSIYFGLAATNTVGDEAVVELFDPEKEASLEYDLARLVYSLSTPDKNVVGLISGVPMTGGFDPQTRQPTQPWIINQQVRQVVEVRDLGTSVSTIDDDVSLLWIVHPTDLDDGTLYAIDQFVLGGGRALIFVDPLAEVSAAAPDPTGLGGSATSSNLERLFDAWGIEFDTTQVVADNRFALSVNTGLGARPVRHIGLLGLDASGMDSTDLVTAGLASINIGTAGRLDVDEESQLELEPLLQSSAESGLIPSARFQFLPDPEQLLDGFFPDGEQHVLAARIRGQLTTAFADGAPEAAAGNEEHLASVDDADLIVVADVDILSDRLWVQRQRSLLGQTMLTAFANNGDFVTNAIGNLAGSSDLVGLRSRATFARPFDRVEALRRAADAEFRATEQRLQAELAETERRLGELQSARDDSNSLLMTPEQQAEVERFQDEQTRIRQELRAVQRELDSSIEGLGTSLQLINIVLVPLLFALGAVLVHWIRRTQAPATR